MLGRPAATTLRGMSNQTETFKIPLEAAEAYEERFVPALFAEWAPLLVEAVDVVPGRRVLDVACGTGIVARTVAERHDSDATIVGVDINEAMLTVARRVRPEITWRQGDVGALPFEDESFDVVLCQFALMFFPDREGAVGEMARLTATDGVVGLSVPAALAAQPAYGPLVEMAAVHAGPEAVSLLSTYWSCGELEYLHGLLATAGLTVTDTRTLSSTAHYPSIAAFLATEIEATPLGERLTAEVYDEIRAGAEEVLSGYLTEAGGVDVPLTGHVVVGRKAN
jgi:SAM-dependent methyltransferase